MTTPKDDTFVKLNIDLIRLPEHQPRKCFDQKELLELGNNIAEIGLIHPVSVRLVDGEYILTAGERRYRASMLVGKKTINAYISGSNDKPIVTLMKQLSENIHRVDLSPLEIAETIYIYQHEYDMNLTDIVKKHGGSKTKWSRYSKINNASDELREAIRERVVTSVNVITHLIDIQAHDIELLHEMLHNIRAQNFSGKLETYTGEMVARTKAESELGYIAPLPDGKGQFDEKHEWVIFEKWCGENGVTFTFKYLQTKLNEWVGGYTLEYGGASVDMPLSVAYKGKTFEELKEAVYELVLGYVAGLKGRHDNEYHIKDFNHLIKVLTLPGRDDELRKTRGNKHTVSLEIKPEDVRREDKYLIIKLNGKTAKVPLDAVRNLL